MDVHVIMDKLKVGVLVVLYGTDKLNIDREKLPDNALLVVVDNTPGQDLGIECDDRISYIPLGDNLGIAEAQNRGIQAAVRSGCSHIIFFDQDSIVPDGFIGGMVSEYERILRHQPALFLLGPTVVNGRDNAEYKSVIHKDHKTDFDFIPRREIISSGSCVSVGRIKEVGLLDSCLFIDGVDFEWCWRANARGLVSGITPNVTLTHFVGQQEFRFLRQLVIVSSPIRYFYQTRNYMWLARRPYVPMSWKVNTGIKRVFYPMLFPFKVERWREIYRSIWRGFSAGLKKPKWSDQKLELS